ncbi:MAG: Uma2 family endonuclease [Planctomycetota bacterium]|nr:Uma2 family endonuclease [Planctomycetota bacterium]
MATETIAERLSPQSNGMLMTADEFDSADAEPGWRYELIRGVVIVVPAPLEQERDPNAELEYLLRQYRYQHPQGHHLDKTLPEHDIQVGDDRRRADRAIWTGLGRRPKRGETPSIVVEFVSAGRRSRTRDYDEKRKEYLGVGVREYWIIDRFTSSMMVYSRSAAGYDNKVLERDDVYSTDHLPGFELPLARLFDLADEWDD